MPCFTGGRQVFLGRDATLDFALDSRWLPLATRNYRLSIKVATAHRKDTALLVTLIPDNGSNLVAKKGNNDQETRLKDANCHRLRLPYTKGLWEETQSVEITLNSKCTGISFQREWTELYGISLKEIVLQAS